MHDGGVPQHHPLPCQREHHSSQSCHHLKSHNFKQCATKFVGQKLMFGCSHSFRTLFKILLAPGETPHQDLLPNLLHLIEFNSKRYLKAQLSPPPSSSLLGWSQTRPLLPRMIEAPMGNWWKWVLRLFTKLGDTLGNKIH